MTPLPASLLEPLPGENPSGVPLRGTELYAQIEEARRHDDNLPKGVWKESRDPKRANFARAAQLCTDGLSKRSKDLQLAAWLCEALLHENGFAGLRDGLELCRGLLESFWDTLYPQLEEDGDAGRRIGVLNWIGTKLALDCRMAALTTEGYGLIAYEQSRQLPNEKASSTDEKHKREKAVTEGKLLPEVFDKAFQNTAKAFYAEMVDQLNGCIKAVDLLAETCKTRFSADDVSFGQLRAAAQAVMDHAQVFLERKREIEPDLEPPDDLTDTAPAAEPLPVAIAGPAAAAVAPAREATRIVIAEPSGRREAVAGVVAAAAYLRRHEPFSPAPYLMLRGLRWGELRAAVAAGDASAFEPAPTEVRTHIKRLVIARRWTEVLGAAEDAMALPAGRAWLDLQRLVVEACDALGRDYSAIAEAVCSATCALLSDVPQLLDAMLLDDTPAANADTRTWVGRLLPNGTSSGARHTWKRIADAYELASDAFDTGNHTRAFEILNDDLERQQSGRERFRRKLQIAELFIKAGKEAIAQPLLDDIAAAVESHKLDEWEDREFIAGVLLTLMQSSKRVQGDAKEKQKLFERICRLHPVKALAC